jgi:hypothetical protein
VPSRCPTYVRFVVLVKDEDSQRLRGVFQAAYDLRDSKRLADEEQQSLVTALKWFSQNLSIPTRFSRSTRPHRHSNAISWYKDHAAEHIARMRQLVAVLERHDVRTQMLVTDRPGYVVYEDDYQIAAVPFRETVA